MFRRWFESLEARRLLATAKFAVIGDYGVDGQPLLDVSNLIKSWNPELVITTGDNNYPAGSAATIDANIGKYFHEYIYHYTGGYGAGSPTRRFLPTLGNHDWDSPTGAAPYLAYFDLPGNERYYEFVQGPVHFFMLDSDPREPDGISAGGVQGQWLQSRLAAATEPHKVVVTHHPPYSSSSVHGSTPQMQWPFAQWGATAVLSGHDHTYERLSVNGTPYLVNGLGGRSLYALGTPLPQSQFRYNADYGAMLIDADDTSMRFRFYARTGALVEDFTYSLGLPAVSVSATDAVAAEPAGAAEFTLTRTGSVGGELNVAFTLSGSATMGVDYDSLPLTAVIPAGAASTKVRITPIDDTAAELSETIRLSIAPGPGYTIAAAVANAALADNDGSNDLLLAGGSAWRYRDDRANLGTGWRANSYIDTSWPEDNARFGYGDPGMVTTINGGPVNNRIITHYFRTGFNVPNPAVYSAATLNVLRDDGAVVYLNGTELWRTNLPAGTVTATTLASAAASTIEETTFIATTIDPALLVAGANRWAVELHQVSATTSDAVFDLFLVGLRDIALPRVDASVFEFEQHHALALRFSEDVAATVDGADLSLTRQEDNQQVPVDASAGGALTLARWSPASPLPDGNYAATLASGSVTDRAGNPLVADFQFNFFVFAGDANRDRTIDIGDFAVLAARFNLPGTFSQGDFNYDGIVDIGDFAILSGKFNTSLPVPGEAKSPAQPFAETSAAPAAGDLDSASSGTRNASATAA